MCDRQWCGLSNREVAAALFLSPKTGFGVTDAAGGTPELPSPVRGMVEAGGLGRASRSQAATEAATSTAIRIGARATTVRTRLLRMGPFAGGMAGTQLPAD